jgi:hypothetical protein
MTACSKWGSSFIQGSGCSIAGRTLPVPESLNFVAPKIRENCFKVQTVATSLEVGFLSLFFWGGCLVSASAAFVFLVAPQ